MIEQTKDIPIAGLVTTTPRKEWQDYNLKTHNVFVGGEETNLQAIMYNDRFVNFMSKWYHVLPNEDVIKVADLVAEQLKFRKFSPTNYHRGNGWFIKDTGHVISNPEKTQISCSYLFDKVDVTGRGDMVELGFTVRNSIDGKGGAFSVSPLSHRISCDNLAFHLAYDKALHTGMKEPKLETGYYKNLVKLEKSAELQMQLKKIQDARADWDMLKKNPKLKKAHFKGLDIAYVTHAILTVKDQADTLIAKYKRLVEMKVEQATADTLAKRMPKTITKAASELKDSVFTWDNKKETIKLGTGATQWQLFNNYTDVLTHVKNRNYTTNLESFKELDKILVAPITV